MTSDKTRIRRLPERGVTDPIEIRGILDEAFVCHTAYVIEDRPVVIPTLFARDGSRLLLHGSNSSGLASAVRNNSPLSVAITHIDALVVARSGFNSSANYRSVVVHGYGRLLDGEEHEAALDTIVEYLLPGRSADIRRPSRSEIKQTAVIEIPLDEVSAKVRTGDPHDEPEDVDPNVWAGVLPLHLAVGEPIAGDDVGQEVPAPDYLVHYSR